MAMQESEVFGVESGGEWVERKSRQLLHFKIDGLYGFALLRIILFILFKSRLFGMQ